MLPFKYSVKNAHERSLIVYSLKCATCRFEYIGKTVRILCHRLKEHRNSKMSALKQHIDENKDHSIDFQNVEIIDSADNQELINILSRQPHQNKQLVSQSSYEIKTLIIQAYPQFRAEK